MSRNRSHMILILFLVIALLLRLAVGLTQDHSSIYQKGGGDSWLYLELGRNLMSGFDYSQISIPTAPLYLVFVGLMQRLFEPVTAIIVIRILQAVMGTLTCYFVYRLAKVIGNSENAGLIASMIMAISPAFIIEAAQVLTETLYIFLISGGLLLYVLAVQRYTPTYWKLFAFSGIFLGLATLTRAVLLLFPLGLAIHLFMIYGWRRGLKVSLIVILAYSLTVSTWTIVNAVKWNRFVVGAEGFWSFLYIGSTESGWQGPTETDQSLAEASGTQNEFPTDPEDQQQLYQNAALGSITSNFPGWLSLRFQRLTNAYLQPHGTVFFPGDSLKDTVANWFSKDRSIAGFIRLIQSDAFWPKLAIYVFHFIGLIGGLVGMWMTRKRWHLTLPLVGFILYTTLAHFVLDVIPRYLFPTQFAWWVFASVTLAVVIDHITHRQPTTKFTVTGSPVIRIKDNHQA